MGLLLAFLLSAWLMFVTLKAFVAIAAQIIRAAWWLGVVVFWLIVWLVRATRDRYSRKSERSKRG